MLRVQNQCRRSVGSLGECPEQHHGPEANRIAGHNQVNKLPYQRHAYKPVIILRMRNGGWSYLGN